MSSKTQGKSLSCDPVQIQILYFQDIMSGHAQSRHFIPTGGNSQISRITQTKARPNQQQSTKSWSSMSDILSTMWFMVAAYQSEYQTCWTNGACFRSHGLESHHCSSLGITQVETLWNDPIPIKDFFLWPQIVHGILQNTCRVLHGSTSLLNLAHQPLSDTSCKMTSFPHRSAFLLTLLSKVTSFSQMHWHNSTSEAPIMAFQVFLASLGGSLHGPITHILGYCTLSITRTTSRLPLPGVTATPIWTKLQRLGALCNKPESAVCPGIRVCLGFFP